MLHLYMLKLLSDKEENYFSFSEYTCSGIWYLNPISLKEYIPPSKTFQVLGTDRWRILSGSIPESLRGLRPNLQELFLNDKPTHWYNNLNIFWRWVMPFKWGLLRPRRDESVDHFQIDLAYMSIFSRLEICWRQFLGVF